MSNLYHWNDRISANVDRCHQAQPRQSHRQSRGVTWRPAQPGVTAGRRNPIKPISLATIGCRGTGSRYLTPRPWDVVTVLVPERKWSRM